MKNKILFTVFMIFICVAIFSLFIGRYPRPFLLTMNLLLNDELAQQIMLNLRLPRLIGASLLGASLSAAGLIFQTFFRNPLADTGILGINQGAGFGAALSIVLYGTRMWFMQIFAVFFAAVSLVIVFGFVKNIKIDNRSVAILLAGIAVSALFSSGIGVLKYIADPLNELPSIVFWLLGDLSAITWRTIKYMAPILLICLIILISLRWRINALGLQQDIIRSMGINTEVLYFLFIGIAVFITALVTSFAGIVSWVGLIVPNIVRNFVGGNAEKTFPLVIFLGAAFTIVCDTLARSLIAGEIPLGILTAFFGASIFGVFMINKPIILGK